MRASLCLPVTAFLLASCAVAPVPPSAPASHATPTPVSIEPDGSTFENAVPVPEENVRDGLRFQRDWLRQHFPGYEKTLSGVSAHEGRHYSVVTIRLPDGSEKVVFFDITLYFNP